MRNGVGKLGLPPATWPEEGKANSLEGFLRRGSTPPPSKGGGINYFPKRVGCGCSWALAGLTLKETASVTMSATAMGTMTVITVLTVRAFDSAKDDDG